MFKLILKGLPPLCSTGLLAVLCLGLSAQQDATTHLRNAEGKPIGFDVVSVRPGTSEAEMRILSPPNSDSITIVNMPLEKIIGWAYGTSIRDQIAGLPDRIGRERYDITAKVAGSDLATFRKVVDPVQRLSMLQDVLQDRFNMTSHYETRELPGYALGLSKSGSKMTEIQPPIGPNGMKEGGRRQVGPGQIRSMGMPMLPLVRQLTIELGRVVVDKTGLMGYYDFTLQWAPDQGSTISGVVDGASSGPSIFTALQEQLGLKLVAAKVPASILVIDQIKEPTEN